MLPGLLHDMFDRQPPPEFLVGISPVKSYFSKSVMLRSNQRRQPCEGSALWSIRVHLVSKQAQRVCQAEGLLQGGTSQSSRNPNLLPHARSAPLACRRLAGHRTEVQV